MATEEKENAQPASKDEEEEDPYAVSSDSEDEDRKGPPPKVTIEGTTDLSELKAALASEKGDKMKDITREEEMKELAAMAKDIQSVRGNFQSGAVGAESEPKAERQKLTEIDKEAYKKFKERFEKLKEDSDLTAEEKRKKIEEEFGQYGGADLLSKAKDRFERGAHQEENEIIKQAIEIQRSDADKKRVDRTFKKPSLTDEDVPKDCAICGKMVYPVEKVFANKRLYHKGCFKCCKCGKSLTPNNYNSHEGNLLCKVHMLEVFHPELAKNMDPSNTEEDEHEQEMEVDEDDEYAVVSKPKTLGKSVVRSGLKSADDFAHITSLRDKKGDWESSVQESQRTERLTEVEKEMIQSGRVKENLTKFVEGASDDAEESEERKRMKEELNFEQVGDIKNKWKTGGMDAAEDRREDRTTELDELKRGPKVKERFQEKTAEELAKEEGANRKSVWEEEGIDTSWRVPHQEDPRKAFLGFLRKRYSSISGSSNSSNGDSCPSSPTTPTADAAAEARRAFLDGAAYQTGPVEKSMKDEIQYGEMGNIKAAFEKGDKDQSEMTSEERGDLKKKEIEEEFQRYKAARRKQELRDEREGQDGSEKEATDGVEDVRSNKEVGNIKQRFEQGTAFGGDEVQRHRPDEDLELKVASKARQKFKDIDATGAAIPVQPQKHEHAPSKWDKEKGDAPEPVNKRLVEDDDEAEDEDAFAVKNLMNKFKNIEKTEDSSDKKPKPMIELEGVNAAEAQRLKERFEAGMKDIEGETAEEKRKRLEEEFSQYKEQKEQDKLNEPEEPEELSVVEKEDPHIAADHASKMAAKWEKMQKKEAKKAQRGQMPQKTQAERCFTCDKPVYMAERVECGGLILHRMCFRCCVCSINLRTETYARGPDGIYCQNHHKEKFNNMARSGFVYRQREDFVVSSA